jgi:hypothetical protein
MLRIADGADFRSSCQLFSMPKLYSSTSSEESFQDIADWMKDCQTHPGCQSSGFSVLPTRVLDVGSDDESVRIKLAPCFILHACHI